MGVKLTDKIYHLFLFRPPNGADLFVVKKDVLTKNCDRLSLVLKYYSVRLHNISTYLHQTFNQRSVFVVAYVCVY